MQGIRSVLRHCGSKQGENDIARLWKQYLGFIGEGEPPDYSVCYPGHLIERLAANVIRGCEKLGLKRFDERTGDPIEIVSIIEEGWAQFLQRPDEYSAWERETLAILSREA
jgi:hypothetical protein